MVTDKRTLMARRFLGYPFFELLFVTLIACVLLSVLLITVRGYLSSPSNVPERASGSQPQEPLAKRTESPALPGSSPTTTVIRIATYNINFGNTFGDEVLSAIADARADILFLQETTLQSEAFLQPRLASWYPHFHVAGHQGRFAAERFVFASKIPCRTSRSRRLNMASLAHLPHGASSRETKSP